MIFEMNKIIAEIKKERRNQDKKWGKQNHGPEFWMLILLEEIGEAAKAILEGAALGYRDEMIQAAAICIAAIESLDRRNLTFDSIVELQKENKRLKDQLR